MKTKKNKEINQETATQAFYREIKELKPRLPVDWKELFMELYPEYNTHKGANRLHHVVNGQSTDPVVMQGMKTIIEAYEAAKEEVSNG